MVQPSTSANGTSVVICTKLMTYGPSLVALPRVLLARPAAMRLVPYRFETAR